jgi:DNA-directed RNA polymerase specialized sigma24 family protein
MSLPTLGSRPCVTDSLKSRIALPLTAEKFDAVLQWLDSDPIAAGSEYVSIQKGLIGMFAAQGFCDAEGLADETINRVADRLPEIGPNYDGKPVHYFRGVARNIIFEVKRRKEIATDLLPERPTKPLDVSDEYNCLLKCLRFLSSKDRDLILDYHVYEGHDKVLNHLTMAEEERISLSNLRVKTFRIRARLEKCVLECMEHLNMRNEKRSNSH